MVGKYTIRLYNGERKEENLAEEQEVYNVVTTKGRERLLDIWGFNLHANDPFERTYYGIEAVDTTPIAITGGIRRCTFQDAAGSTESSRLGDLNTADTIFDPTSMEMSNWSGGNYDDDGRDHWANIDICRVDTEEYLSVVYSNGQYIENLIGNNLREYSVSSNAFVVQDNSKGMTYTEGVDYTYDRELGIVTILESGAITNGENVWVNYIWHDINELFKFGVCGIHKTAWITNGKKFAYRSYGIAKGAYSSDGGYSWGEECLPWHGKPGGHSYYNYQTASGDYFVMGQLNASNCGDNERWFMTLPYVYNNPTNFKMDVSFGNDANWGVRHWKFMTPRISPMSPQAIAVGTDNTTPSQNDIALGTEVAKVELMSAGGSDGVCKWVGVISSEQANDILLKEVGLFFGDEYRNTTTGGWAHLSSIKASSCNELFSRAILDTPITKSSGQTIEVTYELYLTMGASSSSSSSSSSS